MLKINVIKELYPAPVDDEEYWPEMAITDDLELDVTFSGLVDLMKHATPSSWPASGSVYEWLVAEPEVDFRTGETTETSIHFCRNNPPRKAKYWAAAMRAAGLVRT